MADASERDEARDEPRSSVKLVETAKGDVRIELKAYAGDSAEEIDAARLNAQEQYDALVSWMLERGIRSADA